VAQIHNRMPLIPALTDRVRGLDESTIPPSPIRLGQESWCGNAAQQQSDDPSMLEPAELMISAA
jgi:hypothetical protein